MAAPSTTTNQLCNSSSEGYVELPYTLPQDSTLFLVLRETTPEIWMRKLDWIAEHGGMVLLDMHPDYMSFDRLAADAQRSIPSRYTANSSLTSKPGMRASTGMLSRRRWRRTSSKFVPPKRTSDEYDELAPLKTRRLRGKRAAVLLFSHYPADPRPRRAAEALAAQGVNIDLICLAGRRWRTGT